MLRFVKSDICLVHDYCKVSLRPADAGAKETGGRPQAPAKGRLPIGADLSDSLPPAAASEEEEKLGTPQTPAGDFAPCTPLRLRGVERGGGETGAPSHCPPDSVPQTPLRLRGVEPGSRLRVPGSTLTGCLDMPIGRNII